MQTHTSRRRWFASLGAFALLAVATLGLARDFPKDSPKFEKSYRSAMAEAKKANKPVILVFSASWCGPCQQMKHDVYPSAQVKPLQEKFVWAYLDIDEAGNKKSAQEFKVSGIPHVEILDASGKPLDKQVGAVDAAAFAKKLEGALRKAGDAAPATTASKN